MPGQRRWLDRFRSPPADEDRPTLDSEDLRALVDLARQLLQEDHYDKLLDVLIQRALAMLRGERGFIVLVSGEELVFRLARNWSLDELAGDGEQVSRSIIQEVLERGGPILIEDAASDPRYAKSESVLRHRIRSVLAAPLVIDGKAVGVLYLETGDPLHLFGEKELALFHEILDLSARALGRGTRFLILEQERNRLLERSQQAMRPHGIVTRDPRFLQILETVEQVAQANAPVLIQGPSGTGKELVARALHLSSPREKKPFVAVNCGAISPHLIESELFGSVRGAFTGADRDRIGLIAEAESGTVFLDEVGELPLEMQVRLLRTIQFGEIRPVGAAQSTRVDVRFLSATNRNLAREVEEGRFRQDLLYRLNVVTLELPPLSERPDDIPLLFYHFLHKNAEQAKRPVPEVTPELEQALLSYAWPGNVRQLENEVQRILAIVATGIPLEPRHLSSQIGGGNGLEPTAENLPSLEDHQKEAILRHLRLSGGNKTRAAQSLGISREGLRKKMKRLGLVWPPSP